MACQHYECIEKSQQTIISKLLPRGMLQSSIINWNEVDSTQETLNLDRIFRRPNSQTLH